MGEEAVDEVIDAQLDMAIESADDIGDFSAESADETTEASDTGGEAASTVVGDAGGDAASELAAQPAQTQSQQPAPADNAAPQLDQKGNLVDAAGNVVATAGAERRVFERSERFRVENDQLRGQMNQMQQRMKQQDDFSRAPETLGMSREDALVGVQLMHNLKTNPVETARNILQTAVAQGHNLQAILGDIEGVPQSTVDMGAIKHMIDEKLAPITQREQQQHQHQEQQTRNQEQAQNFFRQHEFAELHVDAITDLMQNNRNISPEQAYYEVKTYALSKGLDFTQPLRPQIEARMQQPPAPAGVAPSQPMPNGNASSAVETQSPQVANGDDDWDSIVRQSMTESGMQF